MPIALEASAGRAYVDYGFHIAPILRGHIDEIPSLIADFGIPSFKIFMFYGKHGLHGRSSAQEQFLTLPERGGRTMAADVTEMGTHPSLDHPARPAYHLMGFDIPTFTPVFVMARSTGRTAHAMEQLAGNALIRRHALTRPVRATAGPRSPPARRGARRRSLVCSSRRTRCAPAPLRCASWSRR